MMQSLKIRKIGSSLGAIFPKEVLHDLNLHEGDVIYVVKDVNGVIRLTAFDPAFKEEMTIFAKANKKFRNALKTLADK